MHYRTLKSTPSLYLLDAISNHSLLIRDNQKCPLGDTDLEQSVGDVKGDGSGAVVCGQNTPSGPRETHWECNCWWSIAESLLNCPDQQCCLTQGYAFSQGWPTCNDWLMGAVRHRSPLLHLHMGQLWTALAPKFLMGLEKASISKCITVRRFPLPTAASFLSLHVLFSNIPQLAHACKSLLESLFVNKL